MNGETDRPAAARMRMRLLGVGAMNSPRYRPAGLLVGWAGQRVMIDGGGEAVPHRAVQDWLVCDQRAELMADIRRSARALGVNVHVAEWQGAGLRIRPMPVAHTSHDTFGYLITLGATTVAWAPEFFTFPTWAAGVDVMFADAAGWRSPIRFAGGVGGHAAAVDTAEQARRHGVRRLVFAHIGRPSIKAIDAGLLPPFGEWGHDDQIYRPTARAR